MNLITDVSLGIPFVDLSTVSESITCKFPFLAPCEHRAFMAAASHGLHDEHGAAACRRGIPPSSPGGVPSSSIIMSGRSSTQSKTNLVVESTSLSDPAHYHPRIYAVVLGTEFVRSAGADATSGGRRPSSVAPDRSSEGYVPVDPNQNPLVGTLFPDSPSLSGVKVRLASSLQGEEEENSTGGVSPMLSGTSPQSTRKTAEQQPPRDCIICVIVVTYHEIIVCDLELQSIRHRMNLKNNDVLGTLFCHGEHTTVGIAVGGQTRGGDALLQFPVSRDMKSFLEAARAVFSHHHCGLTLASRKYSTQEELRNALNIQSGSGGGGRFEEGAGLLLAEEEGAGGTSLEVVEIPSQTWSIANLGVPDISDRLANVKSLLGAVERGTKESSIEMEEQIEGAIGKVASLKHIVEHQLEDLQRGLEEQGARTKVLDLQEREIQRLKERATGAREERTAREIDAVEELTQWREVQHHRQTEELEQRKRLAATQRRTQAQINRIDEQTNNVKRELAKVEESQRVFDSDEYKKLTRTRDDEAERMQSALDSLKFLTSAEEAERSMKVSNQARESVAENAALRKLIQSLSVEVHGEERDMHGALIQEGDAAAAESEVLDQGVATALVQREKLEEELLTVEEKERELDADMEKLTHEVLALKAERTEAVRQAASSSRREISKRYFYVQKSMTTEAKRRRATIESAASSQRASLLAARLDVQQRLFAEKLRVQALDKVH